MGYLGGQREDRLLQSGAVDVEETLGREDSLSDQLVPRLTPSHPTHRHTEPLYTSGKPTDS